MTDVARPEVRGPADDTSLRQLRDRALMARGASRLFASRDPDETRHHVGRAMKPHALHLAGRASALEARMHHASFGEVGLHRLRYGADVDILPDRLDDFYLVQMPLAGHARICSGDESLESDPTLASVLSPDDPIRMRWSGDCDQLLLRISRRRLERALAAQQRHAPEAPLRFALGMRWRALPAWRCLVDYLAACAEHGIDATQHGLVCAQIEQLVVTTLLASQTHDGARPARRCTAVLPRHVRKVQDWLQAHAHEPVCVDQMAELAGVSVRSLYEGFRQFTGTSPMQYLKQLRLDRARAELLGGAPSVAGVALGWGFEHLGRFSADYKRRFGESPGQTLRRRG